MSYILIIKEEARLDILDTYLYYEDQQSDLGEKFLSELQKRFDDLTQHPEYYSFIVEDQVLRDISLNIFPYVLIYRIIENEVRIHAVLHTSRNADKKYDR